MSDYTMTVTVESGPAEAEEAIRDALAAEGFGILSEIDVQAALRTKIGEDIGVYKILGACNPPMAHQAITQDADIGALLPCNVVIRENRDGGTDVVAVDPTAMLSIASGELSELACDARDRIQRALDTLG